MPISARSIVMSGMATLTATAIALTPIQALPRDVTVSAPPAVAQQVTSQQLVDLLAAVQRLAQDTPGAATLLVDPQAAPTASLLAFPGLGNAIEDAYNVIEPIVAYGVEWAAWAAGWIPWVGWIAAAQINIFYYDLIEPIAHTITFNIADWISGYISFWQGLNNVILESANAGIGFLNSEISWGWNLLPPIPFPPPQIPYLPWFGLLQTQTTAVGPEAAAEVGVQNAASDLVNAIYTPISNTITYGVNTLQYVLAPIPLVNIAGDQASILWNVLADPIADSFVYDLVDPVLNQPLNINSYLNGAYDVGATTVNALINTGLRELDYFLGVPLATSARTSQLNTMSEVSTVPSTVKDALGGAQDQDETAGPLADVAKTVRNVRNDIRSAFSERHTTDKKQGIDADATGNTVVRTEGARGPIAKAISDVRNAVRGDKPDRSTTSDVTNAPRSIVKSLSDTAKKVVKDVRNAAKDARNTTKDRPAADPGE